MIGVIQGVDVTLHALAVGPMVRAKVLGNRIVCLERGSRRDVVDVHRDIDVEGAVVVARGGIGGSGVGV